MMPKKPTKTELGYVAGVFGVRGEVRLHLHNRKTDALGDAVVLHFEHDGRRWDAEVQVRPGSGGRVLARIEGVSDRNAAEALRGAIFSIDDRELPPLEAGEYYIEELIGMSVHQLGSAVGTVIAVHTTGPIEVIELDGERYLPSTADRLLDIDRDARVLHIAEGALAV